MIRLIAPTQLVVDGYELIGREGGGVGAESSDVGDGEGGVAGTVVDGVMVGEDVDDGGDGGSSEGGGGGRDEEGAMGGGR